MFKFRAVVYDKIDYVASKLTNSEFQVSKMLKSSWIYKQSGFLAVIKCDKSLNTKSEPVWTVMNLIHWIWLFNVCRIVSKLSFYIMKFQSFLK